MLTVGGKVSWAYSDKLTETCKICDGKFFSRKAYRDHKRNTHEKPYHCAEYDFEMGYSGELKRHVIKHCQYDSQTTDTPNDDDDDGNNDSSSAKELPPKKQEKSADWSAEAATASSTADQQQQQQPPTVGGVVEEGERPTSSSDRLPPLKNLEFGTGALNAHTQWPIIRIASCTKTPNILTVIRGWMRRSLILPQLL